MWDQKYSWQVQSTFYFLILNKGQNIRTGIALDLLESKDKKNIIKKTENNNQLILM